MKTKFLREDALKVAQEIYERILPYCERVKIAGSLRRGVPMVGDIEVLLIPKHEIAQGDMLGDPLKVSRFDIEVERLVLGGYLAKRPNALDKFTWGPLNKLAIHVASGIPVDFFATTPENWTNSLFVRTGGKSMNLMVATAAVRRGYSFEAYGSGFQQINGPNHVTNNTEEDIFKFCGLKYLPPTERPS